MELAWSTIRLLSGGQVGNCPVLMRPCLSAPCECCVSSWIAPGGGWMNPVLIDGRWFNCACGTPPCSCTRMCEIVTPGNIAKLVSVNWSGTDIPLDTFRVDNGNRLVRQDGLCWPSCQDMTAPAGAPNTLTVSYVPGIDPGPAGLWAAGVLACEFTKACSGGKCRLPSNVTAIARQGVAMTLTMGMFPNGQTGIIEVDAYISAINPKHLHSPSLVWSPDLAPMKHRFQTWTQPPPEPPAIITAVLTSLVPSTVVATPQFVFDVMGTGFHPDVVLRADDTWTLTRTWISETQLSVSWEAGAGTYDIVATNPDAPPSNGLALTVT